MNDTQNAAQKQSTNTLTIEGLLGQLKAAGLVPLLVIDGFEIGDRKLRHPILEFEGTLPELIDAAVALKTRAVFVSVSRFDEEEFYCELEPLPELKDVPLGDLRGDTSPLVRSTAPTPNRYRLIPSGFTPDHQTLYRREPISEQTQLQEKQPGDKIDLLAKEPRLKPFRKQVGQPFEYFVSFVCEDAVIRLQLKEDWYRNFVKIQQSVIEELEQEREKALSALRDKAAEENERQEEELAVWLPSLKQKLLSDESLVSGYHQYQGTEELIRTKYPDAAAKLGSRLGLLVRELQEEIQKRRHEESRQRMEERMQEEKEEESFYKECQAKLATLKQALPNDAELMALPSKIAMRTYLLDKHPELFETLVPSKRTQEDFINWLFMQKQKKRLGN